METFSALLAICAGISPVPGEFPTHKRQWRGALKFSLICTRINGWVNNGEAGDLRRHHAHYDVTVMDYAGWTITVFHGEYFKLSAHSQCSETMTNTIYFYIFPHNNSARKWKSKDCILTNSVNVLYCQWLPNEFRESINNCNSWNGNKLALIAMDLTPYNQTLQYAWAWYVLWHATKIRSGCGEIIDLYTPIDPQWSSHQS